MANSRERGNFSSMCSTVKIRSEIAKYCVETLKGYGKAGEHVGNNGCNYLRVGGNRRPEKLSVFDQKKFEVIFLCMSLFLGRKYYILKVSLIYQTKMEEPMFKN